MGGGNPKANEPARVNVYHHHDPVTLELTGAQAGGPESDASPAHLHGDHRGLSDVRGAKRRGGVGWKLHRKLEDGQRSPAVTLTLLPEFRTDFISLRPNPGRGNSNSGLI